MDQPTIPEANETTDKNSPVIERVDETIDRFIDAMVPKGVMHILAGASTPGWRINTDTDGCTMYKCAERDDGSLKVQWWDDDNEGTARVVEWRGNVVYCNYSGFDSTVVPGKWLDELKNEIDAAETYRRLRQR